MLPEALLLPADHSPRGYLISGSSSPLAYGVVPEVGRIVTSSPTMAKWERDQEVVLANSRFMLLIACRHRSWVGDCR